MIQVLAVQTVYADQALLTKARSYLTQGQTGRAYALLQAEEEVCAGEVDFDYLLGVAALDNGEPGRAVFALERAVAVEPQFGGARVELARAYFRLGEMHQAKAEFETLLTLNPPNNVRHMAQSHLAAIQSRLNRHKFTFGGYLEMALGNDTNANAATEAESFNGILLSANSKAIPSPFAQNAIGIEIQRPMAKDMQFLAGTHLRRRTHQHAPFVDTASWQGRVGLRKNRGRFTYDANVESQHLEVDKHFNNRGLYVVAQTSYNRDRRTRASGFLRYGAVRFTEAYAIKDIDQVLAGAQWVQVSQAGTMTSAVAFAGRDEPLNASSAFGRDFYAVKVARKTNGLLKTNLFGSVGYMNAVYDGKYLDVTRRDTQVDFSLGAIIEPVKRWQITPQLSYTNNRSTVALYDYDRLNTSITVKRSFL